MKLDKLSTTIERLSKKKTTTIAPIVTKLKGDDTILETAYNHATKEMGDFIKSLLSAVLHLPIREQYEQAVFISNSEYIMEMGNIILSISSI